MAARKADIQRKTNETDIHLSIQLEGEGKYEVSTGVPFLDHMLELFTRHGFFDLSVQASGDIAVDDHHTVEDVGLALGQALREALGDKHGIRRFGEASVPLDEALVSCVVDLSGRPFLAYNLEIRQERVGNFSTELIHDFLPGPDESGRHEPAPEYDPGPQPPPHYRSRLQGFCPGAQQRGRA